jgi:outer membrane protein OmpA-like peptidoglycan-associated protein
MSTNLDTRHQVPEQTHWIPLADLMTGLMMVFLLIAITYMVKVEASQHIREIAILYERMKVELYDDLKKEFERDLPKWGAELDRDSTIRFKEPDVLFAIGSSDLKNNFKSILDDFFPRYVHILDSDKYRDAVEEIRIEGHTSSIWSSLPPDQAYFQNMKLCLRTARGAVCNTCSRYLLSGTMSRG